MDVVFDATDVVEHALLAPHDAADIRVKPLGDFAGDPRGAALGREDDVEQKLGVGAGLGHRVCRFWLLLLRLALGDVRDMAVAASAAVGCGHGVDAVFL